MARINIEDQFWVDVMPLVKALGGDLDVAVGQALRFFKVAQEKHKNGRLISEDEFAMQQFSDKLIGIFAERVDGGIRCIGAQKHFAWLDVKREAGRIGGRSKTEAKTSTLKQNRSKTKQTEASSSSSSSSSSSDSSSSKKERVEESEILPPLAILWNENCGELPKVKKTNSRRTKKAQAIIGENTRDEWVEVIRKIAASDFCLGKSDRGWKATFDWLCQPETHLKVMEGKYDGATKESAADYLSSMKIFNPPEAS